MSPENLKIARRYYRWDLVNDVENVRLIEQRTSKIKSLLEF